MTEILLITLCILMLLNLAFLIVLLTKRKNDITAEQIDAIRDDLLQAQQSQRMELLDMTQRSIRNMGEMIGEKQENSRKIIVDMNASMEARLSHFSLESETKLENIRATMEKRLSGLQEENSKKLEEMRVVVDEKLQKTLDERMTRSFALVNERLEQVYKGLGEMQTLAIGVGDLKKVLSGVKTRGTLGEIQLGAILDEILAPEQYEKNFYVDKDGKRPVEFAVKMPGNDSESVYLPIDSKFPMDAYNDLLSAYDTAQLDALKLAQSVLRSRIREFAKAIKDKYIEPPYTTDFAIMFLPTEGLYAEVVKMGMLEQLQHEFRVCIAGPSTMAAILNSLQMGFRSLAIQKRSGEVWKVLSAVRTEFDKFQDTLQKTQERLVKANNDLDMLIGVRTRQIRRSLKNVTSMPQEEVPLFLPDVGREGYESEDGSDE